MQHRGVATLLRQRYHLLQTFHCMAHRLELAVKNTVDTVYAVSHFRIFIDTLYKVYSMSPKNQRELNCIADSLSIELLKIQKVFDVRWVFFLLCCSKGCTAWFHCTAYIGILLIVHLSIVSSLQRKRQNIVALPASYSHGFLLPRRTVYY